MPSPTKILYEAKKPRPGTVIFTSATSFAIVASAFWVPLAFAWSARRIVSMDEKNSDEEEALERKKTERKKKKRRAIGIFILCAILAWMPIRRWRWLHQLSVWDIWFEHLQVKVIGEEPPRRQLLYAIVPHGVFPFSLGFAALGHLREKIFRLERIIVANAVMWVPVLRHIAGWLGVIQADREKVSAALSSGATVAVAPGGIGEMFYPRPGCPPDHEYALLRQRKGFIRMALQHGVPLVPVYVFGSNQLLRRLPMPAIVERFSRYIQASLVVPFGRWGLPIPFPVPLLYAIGDPIDVGLPSTNPSDAQVDGLHARFCDALVDLFNKHRHEYGWGHKELRLV
uniref:Acyltransferase n=1 Tax=Octactis speculum TaxID=3111310 RepID=A0A7S2C4T0_9STRA|mmetsp:Transcript_31659/g.42883  ORF Transcript_31659/g.42883 Transcript_31659/m.42883 type:complete len:341 (+) Transcript_31659:47-1069(+)